LADYKDEAGIGLLLLGGRFVSKKRPGKRVAILAVCVLTGRLGGAEIELEQVGSRAGRSAQQFVEEGAAAMDHLAVGLD
jgi:hypothetical protein